LPEGEGGKKGEGDGFTFNVSYAKRGEGKEREGKEPPYALNTGEEVRPDFYHVPYG